MARGNRSSRKIEDATPRWVDKTFPLSENVMGRLRGNAQEEEGAYLLLTCEGEDGAENTRLISLGTLKKLCAELQDFIARMQSMGGH